MKLGIVTSYPPSKVTLNEYAFHLVKHFRQIGVISEIILYTDVSTEKAEISFQEKGCKITVMPCWKFNSNKTLFTVTKAIAKTKPNAVLYNLQFMKFGSNKIAAALGLFLPWATKKMRIPTIVLLHNIMETVNLNEAGFSNSKFKSWLLDRIGTGLTRIILKADKVAVTIEQYVHELQQKYLATNVVLIPHGTFEIAEKPEFHSSNDTLKIMTFGKFGTYKKVENLVDAVLQVRKDTKQQVELIIAGTDNPNTPGYLDAVSKKYEEVSNLTFTGYVEEADVPKLFSESDIIVFPYTATTGSSGVLHQAGSYGKAVVMPDLGDLARLVKDEGYRGEFFEPTSTQSMATAIKRLLLDEQHRVEIAKANYLAATSWPMTRVVSRYMEEFEDCTTSKKTGWLHTLVTSFL